MTRRGAYETELWAMIKCLQVWKHYLHGTSVEIRTDHAPLKYFHTQGKLTDKIVRWLDFLSEFDFTVTHIPGESNMAADCFSRNPRFYKEDPFWKEHLEKIKASCVSMSSCEVISFLGAKKYQYRSSYLMAIRVTSNISTRSSHARQLTQWMESVKASYLTDEFTKKSSTTLMSMPITKSSMEFCTEPIRITVSGCMYQSQQKWCEMTGYN